MTRSAVLLSTASEAFDSLLLGGLGSPGSADYEERLAEFRRDFGLEHWEQRVRSLDGRGWQVFFSESEEDGFEDIGWRIGYLVQDVASSVSDDHKVVLYDNQENQISKDIARTLVWAGLAPASGLLVVSFTDDVYQEGGSLTTYIVGEVADADRRKLGLLYPHERSGR